jgi:hypothetical protein
LRANRWTAEMNFLAWQLHAGPKLLDLPAGVTLRLSLQWREARESSLRAAGEDLERAPLSPLSLRVLRQRDPTGRKLPLDAMELAASSEQAAPRATPHLDDSCNVVEFEHTLVFRAERAGRYAVQVLGKPYPSTWPPDVPVIPAVDRSGELRPRLFVQVLDPNPSRPGRAVWQDYQTDEGAFGMPADSRAVLTVAASTEDGRPRVYAPAGSPYNLRLLKKPEVLAPDGLERGEDGAAVTGSGASAAYAAGVVAAALSAGASRQAVFEAWRQRQTVGWDLPATKPFGH